MSCCTGTVMKGDLNSINNRLTKIESMLCQRAGGLGISKKNWVWCIAKMCDRILTKVDI